VKARKKAKLRGRQLAGRLTGISTPIGGISWKPPVDEQDKARRLLVYLSDRRALYYAYDREIGPFVIRSVLEIRKRMTKDLEDVSSESVLGEALRAMQAACRKFLDENQSPRRDYWSGFEGHLYSTLGELRALFGIHIARLACAYNLDVGNELASILPAEAEEKLKATKKRRKSRK
jgi:hypothetical protein